MGRDRLGRWEKGTTGNAGGVTHHEIKAARRLKQRLAGLVDEAANTLQRSINGEDVDSAAVASAKFVVEQTIGRAGQTRTISGHIDHRHEHSISDNYVAALRTGKPLAACNTLVLNG